jgi:hypothetical protein
MIDPMMCVSVVIILGNFLSKNVLAAANATKDKNADDKAKLKAKGQMPVRQLFYAHSHRKQSIYRFHRLVASTETAMEWSCKASAKVKLVAGGRISVQQEEMRRSKLTHATRRIERALS